MQRPDIRTLETFVAVVEAGSFSRAAEKLETTPGAVSRRVSALERRLGLRLLNRTTRKISLTEAGNQYYADLNGILQALSEAENRISHHAEEPTGTLRIAAPLSFGIRALAPLLPDFAVRFPQHWQIHNLPDRVIATAPANDAMLQLSTLPADPRQTPQQFLSSKLGLKAVSRGQTMTLHGLPAYTATGLVNTSNGQSLARITVIYHHNRAFILAGMTRDNSLGTYDSAFLQYARSFRPLTSAEQAYALRTNHLELVQAKADTTFQGLAAQTPLEKFPEDQLRLLNAMYPKGRIQAGELIKTVTK